MPLLATASCRRRAGARSRARSTSSSPRSRGSPPTASARSRCSGQNVNSYGRDLRAASARRSPSCCARVDAIDGIDRIRYTSPHPKDMREDVDPRARRAARASASTSTCRCRRAPSRILKAMRRTYDRERYLDRVALIREHVPDVRADDRHHRRLPGGDRGGLRARRSRSSRRSATTARSRSSSRRAAAPRRPTLDRRLVAARGEGRADGAARRGRPAPRARARPALRRAHARRARRGHRRARTRRGCAAARATTRSSTSPASPRPGEIVPVRDRRGDEPDARAASMSLLARAERAEPRVRPSAYANICSCAGRTDRRRRASRAGCPGYADAAVVRRFDAPEALDTRFHEVRAKSALNRVPRALARCRSSGRSTRTGAAAMPASTASPGRPTSTSTSTPGATSSARSSSRSTCPRCCGRSWRGRRGSGEHVALGTNTDPYQWVEGRYKLMRGIWEALRDAATRARS